MSWRVKKQTPKMLPQWLIDLAKHSCPLCAPETGKKAA
jgi:hypothetical protein